MKLFFNYFVFAVLIVFLAAPVAQAQTDRFPIGEKLTYHISFANFTDAGFLELQTVNREKVGERDAIRLRARLKTTGTVGATLLALENEYNSLIAPENGLPLRIERTLRESIAPTETRRDFVENTIETPNSAHDLLSAVYQIRKMQLAVGSAFPLQVWENNQIYNANARVVKRETVSTPVGAFNAFVVQIHPTNNEKYSRFRFVIRVSDDERRIPISFQIKIPKGEIRAELASVQMILPEVAAPVVVPTPQVIAPPVVVPTPFVAPTPRPTPVPKPYVENQPLAADLPFALGEKLRFDVSRQNQKIAAVQLEVKERKQFLGRDAVMLSATVIESKDPLLSPGTSVVSYIHPEYLTPYRGEIRAGGTLNNFSSQLNFDQIRGSVTTEKGASVEIPIGTYDLLSLAYAFRAFRYDTNKPTANATRDTKAAVFLSGNPVVLTFRPTGREKITVGGTQISTTAIALSTGNPQFDSLNVRLWLSEDARHLPMRLAFNSPFGAIQADLTNFTPVSQ